MLRRLGHFEDNPLFGDEGAHGLVGRLAAVEAAKSRAAALTAAERALCARVRRVAGCRCAA